MGELETYGVYWGDTGRLEEAADDGAEAVQEMLADDLYHFCDAFESADPSVEVLGRGLEALGIVYVSWFSGEVDDDWTRFVKDGIRSGGEAFITQSIRQGEGTTGYDAALSAQITELVQAQVARLTTEWQALFAPYTFSVGFTGEEDPAGAIASSIVQSAREGVEVDARIPDDAVLEVLEDAYAYGNALMILTLVNQGYEYDPDVVQRSRRCLQQAGLSMTINTLRLLSHGLRQASQ